MREVIGMVSRRGWAAVRAAHDRGFAPTLRQDPSAPLLLLSPHLDDAIIDCWSVLRRDADVTVVNVFAGAPPPGTVSPWDRLCRAGDSAAIMAARVAEDREALALAGRQPIDLPFAGDAYRTPRQTPTLAQIDRALTAVAPAASLVLAPAVLGTVHPDHLLVREYALALARAGMPIELYADLPYAVQFGWPPWVDRADEDPHLDPEASWLASGAHLSRLNATNARVVALDSAEAAAKLEAMRRYRTQFAMLDRGPIGLLSNARVHGFEVFWPIT